MNIPPRADMDRRQLLRRSGLLGLGALVGPASLVATQVITPPRRGVHAPDSRILGPVPGMASKVQSCTLTPSLTEGPYYFNAALLRRDMTDRRPGLPLFVQLQVVKASNCSPVQGAVVDLWHCDADGLYAGYPGQLNNVNTEGENFLRGIQVTDANGDVTFQTIYPGWYPGRTVHIHVKVLVAGRAVVTSQLYFPDDISDLVFQTIEAYGARGNQGRTTNARDGLYRAATLMTLAQQGAAYLARFAIGIA